MTVVRSAPRLRTVDWQSLPTDRLALLYAEEADRWSRQLEWETAPRWSDLERRRRQGLASGLAVVDESGAIVGWCHYALRQRQRHIDTFNASAESVGQAMLDRLFSTPTLATPDRVTLFALSDATWLAQALRTKGLAVDRYWYLGRDLGPSAPLGPPAVRRWSATDLPATAALFGRAYEPGAETRPFAPGGTPGEWSAYAGELARGVGGTLLADASLCLPEGPDHLIAVAIVTRVAEGTAHLTQLVVDPPMRQRRLGLQLMELASAAAARAGCRRMTVLVGGSNRRARSLFEASRFRAMGSFLAASTLQPRRSTSVAPVGAVITRR